jgi:Txe/YoeB family toxin of Txe-Axe toxin-antitoxin module
MNNVSPPSAKTGQVYVDSLTGRAYEDPFGACADFEPPLPEKLALVPEPEIVPGPVKDSRMRRKFEFWLNVLNDDHFELAQKMDSLKNQRRFARTIRDGVRLVVDLRAGRIDVLLQLFPWVKDAIAQEIMR